MSEIFPTDTPDDEDPREEQEAEKRREDEIQSDKPPHHD